MPGMALRTWAGEFAGGTVATGMARLNARHPWSHNDHFHSWILANLPVRRRLGFRHTIAWTKPS